MAGAAPGLAAGQAGSLPAQVGEMQMLVADQARTLELASGAVALCRKALKPDGVFLVKAFHGEAFDELLRGLKAAFGKIKVVKPRASRGESAETYVLARSLRADRVR